MSFSIPIESRSALDGSNMWSDTVYLKKSPAWQTIAQRAAVAGVMHVLRSVQHGVSITCYVHGNGTVPCTSLVVAKAAFESMARSSGVIRLRSGIVQNLLTSRNSTIATDNRPIIGKERHRAPHDRKTAMLAKIT